MLSNLVITTQSFVLIIDELGQEKVADKFLSQLLREQGQLTIKKLPVNCALKEKNILSKFVSECARKRDGKWNVLLPPLSDLLVFVRAAEVFELVDRLRNCESVERVFLWLSKAHLLHARADYLMAAFRHMADVVLHLETGTELSITTRRYGGGVTVKHYTYTRSKNEFLVQSTTKSAKRLPEKASPPKTEPVSATFKIELDEDELTARNALKLPYEKTSDTAKETADDAGDDGDYDDDDLDDDLCM